MATAGPTFEPVWDDRGRCWRIGQYDDAICGYRYLPGAGTSRDPWYAGSCAAIAAALSAALVSRSVQDHTGLMWPVGEHDITEAQMRPIADAATAALSTLSKAEAAALAELNALGMTLKSKATVAKLRSKRLVDERGKLTPAGVFRARSLAKAQDDHAR